MVVGLTGVSKVKRSEGVSAYSHAWPHPDFWARMSGAERSKAKHSFVMDGIMENESGVAASKMNKGNRVHR